MDMQMLREYAIPEHQQRQRKNMVSHGDDMMTWQQPVAMLNDATLALI